MGRVERVLILVAAALVPQVAVAQDATEELMPMEVLSALQGTWAFELFPTGETEPTRTGTRTFRQAHDDHPMLMWVERFDGANIVVAGVLGYDKTRSQFYELGAPGEGPVEYWVGSLSSGGRSIDWRDPGDVTSPSRGELRVASLDLIEFRNESFVAVFSRPAR